jgi:hypothetical protein
MMSVMRSLRHLLACALVLLLCRAAVAQEAAPDDPRARKFFEIGAQAYRKGQYLLAIEAFEQAYSVVKRPGLLFSLGQAHQRQFRVSGKPAHLEGAIANYRRYLAADSDGARHDNALKALDSLLPVAERMRGDTADAKSSSKIFGRLLLSSSTPDAVITVGGETVSALPAALELPADQYTVEASAAGYVPESLQIRLVAGSVVPISIELRPKPALLAISGPAGAEAYVDGRPVGFLPLSALSFASGPHLVSVRQLGKKTRSMNVLLERGATKHVTLELATSVQRKVAYGFGVGSAVALSVTVVSAVVATSYAKDADDLNSQRASWPLTAAEAQALNSAVRDRDRYRAIALGSGVIAAGLLGTGLVLYFADNPAPPGRDVATRERSRFVKLEPLIAPELVGLGLQGRL